jgi:hypothetical protein
MTASEEEFVQPNVVILLILMASWLIAMHLNKRQNQDENGATKGNRL